MPRDIFYLKVLFCFYFFNSKLKYYNGLCFISKGKRKVKRKVENNIENKLKSYLKSNGENKLESNVDRDKIWIWKNILYRLSKT